MIIHIHIFSFENQKKKERKKNIKIIVLNNPVMFFLISTYSVDKLIIELIVIIYLAPKIAQQAPKYLQINDTGSLPSGPINGGHILINCLKVLILFF